MKRIFSLSFIILFLELSLIRWIPANIRLVGYFSNLILIATFLGIGIGFLLTKKKDLIFYFPILLVILVLVVSFAKIEVNIGNSEIIFFKAIPEQLLRLEPEIILPIIFILTTFVFIPIAQALAKLFPNFKPLTSYSLDIAGSIFGVAVFSIISYLSVPAPYWFLIISVTFLLLTFKLNRVFAIEFLVLAFLVGFMFIKQEKNTIWSPYYKINYEEARVPGTNHVAYPIFVNNIIHQYVSNYSDREEFYYTPYTLFANHFYKNILIVGSGNGADVATAIAFDPRIERVDAVEIDPKIYELGKKLNPNRPFNDPKVHVYIDDGRTFLEKTNKKYDLIIYAETDSLILANNASNIRLESFLYTKEAFDLARKHLSGNGVFILYNYYRENWLIDKLAGMSRSVFDKAPYVISYGDELKAAVIINGPKTSEINKSSGIKQFISNINIDPATDNWPFLYLKNMSIPSFYLKFIAILAVISIALVFLTQKLEGKFGINIRFFAFGTGFMLLETKSLVNFAQLFGTTWTVNSLVIIAILSFVLLANFISSKITFKYDIILYAILFILLVLQLIVPTHYFASLSIVLRYILTSSFYFAPIFIANVIFSQKFKNSKETSLSFGSNILGVVAGGFLEYSSLAIGYQALVVLVVIAYAVSFIKIQK